MKKNLRSFGGCLSFLLMYFLEWCSTCVASRVIFGILDPILTDLLVIMFFILSTAMILGFHLITKMETELNSHWSKSIYFGFSEAVVVSTSCEIFHCIWRGKCSFL